MTFDIFAEINRTNAEYLERTKDADAKVAAMSEVLRAAMLDPDFPKAMALLETKAAFHGKRIAR
tara:strand:+ start:374 stop:565 length:192 start_codon:yes stop_codon:yes gene_type:complete